MTSTKVSPFKANNGRDPRIGQQKVRLKVFKKVRKELEKMERNEVLPKKEP